MIHYMSTMDIARALKMRESTVRGKHLPTPDSMTGKTPGWLPATVEGWAAARGLLLQESESDTPHSSAHRA